MTPLHIEATWTCSRCGTQEQTTRTSLPDMEMRAARPYGWRKLGADHILCPGCAKRATQMNVEPAVEPARDTIILYPTRRLWGKVVHAHNDGSVTVELLGSVHDYRELWPAGKWVHQ